jgi:glucose-1-phosphate thymidylyltransferase
LPEVSLAKQLGSGNNSAMPGPESDKLVVLARGLGTRMRQANDAVALDQRQTAAADSGIKALIPLDERGHGNGVGNRFTPGRPFLDYVLSAVAEAGFRRVCLVIGPEQEAIRHYYTERVAAERLRFAFACQREPRGTADAVAAAEAFAGDDPFVAINSDTYYPVEALRALRQQPGCAVALFERDAMLAGSNMTEERIKRFAVAKIDERGCLEQIVEKPDDAMLAAMPRPIWLSMNCWRFGPSIFAACRAIRPSPRGEFEIPDAVQYAVSTLGATFRAVTIRAPVLDLTSRGDIAPVAAILAGMEARL